MGELSVGVKNDWNWFSSRWAFVLLSVARLVLCLSGVTPVFSFRFDFTYAQKGWCCLRRSPPRWFVEVGPFCFVYMSAAFFLKVAVVGPILVFFGASFFCLRSFIMLFSQGTLQCCLQVLDGTNLSTSLVMAFLKVF